ncbi:hypothetical protein DFS34DRAFT_644037 [Phlyctochytrium arcticum]|nr:hypothetical protein DFS34DRAFT_644037 [Phlyctochytrium arcticum]
MGDDDEGREGGAAQQEFVPVATPETVISTSTIPNVQGKAVKSLVSSTQQSHNLTVTSNITPPQTPPPIHPTPAASPAKSPATAADGSITPTPEAAATPRLYLHLTYEQTPAELESVVVKSLFDVTIRSGARDKSDAIKATGEALEEVRHVWGVDSVEWKEVMAVLHCFGFPTAGASINDATDTPSVNNDDDPVALSHSLASAACRNSRRLSELLFSILYVRGRILATAYRTKNLRLEAETSRMARMKTQMDRLKDRLAEKTQQLEEERTRRIAAEKTLKSALQDTMNAERARSEAVRALLVAKIRRELGTPSPSPSSDRDGSGSGKSVQGVAGVASSFNSSVAEGDNVAGETNDDSLSLESSTGTVVDANHTRQRQNQRASMDTSRLLAAAAEAYRDLHQQADLGPARGVSWDREDNVDDDEDGYQRHSGVPPRGGRSATHAYDDATTIGSLDSDLGDEIEHIQSTPVATQRSTVADAEGSQSSWYQKFPRESLQQQDQSLIDERTEEENESAAALISQTLTKLEANTEKFMLTPPTPASSTPPSPTQKTASSSPDSIAKSALRPVQRIFNRRARHSLFVTSTSGTNEPDLRRVSLNIRRDSKLNLKAEAFGARNFQSMDLSRSGPNNGFLVDQDEDESEKVVSFHDMLTAPVPESHRDRISDPIPATAAAKPAKTYMMRKSVDVMRRLVSGGNNSNNHHDRDAPPDSNASVTGSQGSLSSFDISSFRTNNPTEKPKKGLVRRMTRFFSLPNLRAAASQNSSGTGNDGKLSPTRSGKKRESRPSMGSRSNSGGFVPTRPTAAMEPPSHNEVGGVLADVTEDDETANMAPIVKMDGFYDHQNDTTDRSQASLSRPSLTRRHVPSASFDSGSTSTGSFATAREGGSSGTNSARNLTLTRTARFSTDPPITIPRSSTGPTSPSSSGTGSTSSSSTSSSVTLTTAPITPTIPSTNESKRLSMAGLPSAMKPGTESAPPQQRKVVEEDLPLQVIRDRHAKRMRRTSLQILAERGVDFSRSEYFEPNTSVTNQQQQQPLISLTPPPQLQQPRRVASSTSIVSSTTQDYRRHSWAVSSFPQQQPPTYPHFTPPPNPYTMGHIHPYYTHHQAMYAPPPPQPWMYQFAAPSPPPPPSSSVSSASGISPNNNNATSQPQSLQPPTGPGYLGMNMMGMY